MATTDTDDRSEPLDPEVLDQLFATIGHSAHKERSRPQPTEVAAPKRERPLSTYDSPRPMPRRASQTEYADAARSWRDWLPTVWLVGCLLVAGLCLLMGMPNSPLRKTTVGATVAKYVEQPRTRDIEDFDVGMRALGNNPLHDQVETAPEPDPETSRKLVLRMKKESGLRLDAKLLRSVVWIEAVGAKEGGTFFLDLPEMGAVGDAYVEAILPCPPIEQGPGNVVTGVFAHEADPDTVILSVTFANGAYIKGVTDNHPFFSVGQNDFVEIGKMREGDSVKVNDGVTHITKIESRFARPGEMLYNLETHNQHVYQVTTAGILVHNSCVNKGGRFSDLDAIKKPGQVVHHMPQNAAGIVSRGRGPGLGMTIEDHQMTRTFAGRGRITNATDASLTPLQRLELDVADIRRLFGNKYDKGIQEMLDYARTLPEFQ